jgi:apolipoprotein N-acyltransferase
MKNIRFIGIALSLVILLVCGFVMSRIPLWEWWTFGFLSALWALIVLLRLKKYNIRWLGLSTLSGIFLSLGFPNSPLTPFMFVGFIPLLFIQKEMSESKSRDGILKYAFNAFVIWNILTTWWVANAVLAGGLIANYLNAFFMCLPFWLFHKTDAAINPNWLMKNGILQKVRADEILKYGAFITYWLAFEYVHLNWEISWTWLTLGNAFAEYPSWVQWYEYTGVFGGSLWILLLNVLIFRLLDKKYFKQNSIKTAFIQCAAWLITPLSISAILGIEKPDAAGGKLNIVVVQPNYEPIYEKFEISEHIQIKKFLQLASEKVDSTTDYLVFPETSFDFRHVDRWNDNPIVQELKDFTKRYPNLHLVTGIDAIRIYAPYVREKPAGLPSTVREHDNNDGTFTYWENYNASTQITAGSDLMPMYVKSKFVPGPEILPYGFLFSWLKPVFKKFGGTVGGLGMQAERSVFWNRDGQSAVGAMICYESIYGDFCTGFVKNGADALFVVSNDGWWGDTPGYEQLKKFACLRAIETRRPVVRSANTGSSCFIDSYGHISDATDYGVDACIEKTIEVGTRKTVYTFLGDFIGRQSTVLAIGFLIGLFLRVTFLRDKK